jgi:hypothetical protein
MLLDLPEVESPPVVPAALPDPPDSCVPGSVPILAEPVLPSAVLEPVVPVVPEAPLMLEPLLLFMSLVVSDVPLLRDWLPEVVPPMPAPPPVPDVPRVVAALLPLGVLPMPPPVPPPVLCAMVEPANAIAASSTAIEVFLMLAPCPVI